jgi:regulator of cell morphogenesis and NO signaling
MTALENKTVADTVAQNIKTAHVFKKHGIDFCCGGGISIKKACEKHNVNYSTLEQELLATEKASKTYDYNSWELEFLINHIVHIHHAYVEESIPLLLQYAERVAKVHGHHYKEVIEIKDLFVEAAQELTTHMKKEEIILFPYIKKLKALQKAEQKPDTPPFKTINNPIQMMEEEHEHAGDIFKKINALSNNYTPPEEACNTFKALYAKLQEFEEDLHLHIHLENNILHPKAIILENSLC